MGKAILDVTNNAFLIDNSKATRGLIGILEEVCGVNFSEARYQQMWNDRERNFIEANRKQEEVDYLEKGYH